MQRTVARLFSKRITIPRLSPTHTKARIVRFEAPEPSPSFNYKAEVVAYDPIMILEVSPDLVMIEHRDYPDQTTLMVVETQDEGMVKQLNDHGGKWIDIGTPFGIIDDGDEIDGDWTWQAYYHTETESETI